MKCKTSGKEHYNLSRELTRNVDNRIHINQAQVSINLPSRVGSTIYYIPPKHLF